MKLKDIRKEWRLRPKLKVWISKRNNKSEFYFIRTELYPTKWFIIGLFIFLKFKKFSIHIYFEWWDYRFPAKRKKL